MSTSNFNQRKFFCLGDLGRELVAVAAAIVSILIVMEVLLRTFDNFGLNGPDKLNVETAAGEDIYYGMPWRKTEFQQVSKPNKMGLIAPDFASRMNGDKRIAIYGGSMVEARHLPFADNFVGQADRKLMGFHLLPIGKGGYTAAVWLPYFISRYDQNFGPTGHYPRIDAAVVTLSAKDYADLRFAEHELGLRNPHLSWRVKLKYDLVQTCAAYFKERIRSVFASISFLSHKLYNWFWADYRNTFAEPSTEELQWLQDTMQKQVLKRWKVQAEDRKLPLGVLYLGNKNDYEQWSNGHWTRWRLFAQAASDNLGLPFVDTTEYYRGGVDQLFYIHDGHPTKIGYEKSAIALSDLINLMVLDRKRK